jgi:spermidine dehydrogenase
MEDMVTARADYARLDEAASPVRLRLESTAVRVRHAGAASSSREVEVAYVRGGRLESVRARSCVLACWNGVIPTPLTAGKQKGGAAYVKAPGLRRQRA